MDRRRRWALTAATVVPAFAVLCAAAEVILFLVSGADLRRPLGSSFASELVSVLAWPTLAGLVLRRQPGNRLAWLFVAVGLGFAIGNLGEAYAYAAWHRPGFGLPGAVWVKLVGYTFSEAAWPLLWIVPQLFPDGRPATPGLRWGVRFGVGWIAVMGTANIFQPGRPEASWLEDNPLGVRFAATVLHWPPNHAVFVVGILGVTLLSLAVRLVRGGPLQRRQVGLFLAAVVGLVVLIPFDSWLHDGGWALAGVGTLLPPLALGVAILRYRLYELDRLVSRTVTYAVLTAALGALYLLVVTATTRVLPISSSVGVALATLVVASAVQPLRRRLQRSVDRRFDRRRYDAERTVESFVGRLRHGVELDAVHAELLQVVGATVAPAHASLWLAHRPGDTATSGG